MIESSELLRSYAEGIRRLSGVGSVGAGQDVAGIAFWAHIAGFATGAVAIFFFRRPERQRVAWWGRR